MQSKTEDFRAELEAYIPSKKRLRSFELYSEYSHRDIAETIQMRKDAYEKTCSQARKELEKEVEIEVENFRVWLESVKRLLPFEARYYSVSLKSLLLGLPIGVNVARLFDVVLEKLET